MSFPRYQTYKDSGVEWLGDVPEHWSVNRFKLSVESCTNGVWGEEASNDENDVTCIRVADFDRHRLEARDPDEPTIRNVSDRDIEQRSLRKGDLLIEKSGGGEKQPVGAVVLYIGTPPAVCSNFVARMRLKRGQSPSFWRYAHHAAYSLRVNTKSIKQTSGIQNLDQQQYLDESAAYPSLDEQLAIGNFLDRETAKIDALIAEQQCLIELLQEKRQAVISHAVTKGLNPNAPMKDSGVEWLGEVPDHWVVASIRRYIRIAEGQVDPRLDTYSAMTLIAPNHIESGTGLLTSLETAGEQGAESGKYLCDLGDVVYSKIRPALRKACIAPETCLTSADMYPLKAMDGMSNEFLLNFLLSPQFSALAIVESERVAMPKINRDALLAVSVAVPPLSEQQEICSHVKELTTRIDQLSVQASSSITLMNERRTALISAAVTGQIDVRGLSEAECGEQ